MYDRVEGKNIATFWIFGSSSNMRVRTNLRKVEYIFCAASSSSSWEEKRKVPSSTYSRELRNNMIPFDSVHCAINLPFWFQGFF